MRFDVTDAQGTVHTMDTDKFESKFLNIDCMEVLKRMPDKCVDLCIVDPPYGIERLKNPKGFFEKYGDTRKANDDMPDEEYFRLLSRVSENQIIWGGNYFNLPPCRGFICWDKLQYYPNYSQAEFAWTSFKRPAKIFRCSSTDVSRIHPTQKPVKLYEWLLSNYAKPGDKILDTHVGSASSLIACHQMGFEYWGFELDADYYNAATERLNKAKAQVDIFEAAELPKPEQIGIEEGK